MTDMISTDSSLTEDDLGALRVIAGTIIPASEHYQIPGADDESIFNTIVAIAREQGDDTLKRQLTELQTRCHDRHQCAVEELSPQDRTALLKDSSHARFLYRMIHLTANAYYQDGRVLASMDLKDEPPFPGGHDVPEGDWSLLDPVREREPFYTKV
ncbi:MAG: gluconate 2-dehydrogenase subunit 3 family protein [Pseudomonadota bacterium]